MAKIIEIKALFWFKTYLIQKNPTRRFFQWPNKAKPKNLKSCNIWASKVFILTIWRLWNWIFGKILPILRAWIPQTQSLESPKLSKIACFTPFCLEINIFSKCDKDSFYTFVCSSFWQTHYKSRLPTLNNWWKLNLLFLMFKSLFRCNFLPIANS